MHFKKMVLQDIFQVNQLYQLIW